MKNRWALWGVTLLLITTFLGCAADDGTPSTSVEQEEADAEAAADAEAPSADDDAVEDDSTGSDAAEEEDDAASRSKDPQDTTETDDSSDTECVTVADCAQDTPIQECWEAVCEEGKCKILPKEEGTACGDEDNLCAPSSGTCTAEGTCDAEVTEINCDDSNPCTDDSCDPATGCVNTANTEPCDDEDACTQIDVCAEGTCKGTSPLDCGDDNSCTFDSCDAVEGCVNDALSKNGEPCDDGESCTDGDTCEEGVCLPGSVTLEDGALECVACSEESPCAQTEDLCDALFSCENGFCKADSATVTDCSDEDACTVDTCNPIDGTCSNAPAEEGASCEDGNPCTEDTVCTEGLCVGTPVSGCTPGCEASDQPGCGGCECEECVCDLDSFCCDIYWDTSCVKLCSDNCGQDCGPVIDPDACDPGEIPKCPGQSGCTYASWLGDGICDSYLDCEFYDFDDGDCTPCYPECDGKNCGPDGCGGNCGTCGSGEFCYDGVCEVPCGNGTCEVEQSENCKTCPDDCGACPVGTGCETSDQPSCGGCACEECVCALDDLCCTTAWDSSCVLLCINDCGGCDYDDGCFENILPAISGSDGTCSIDAAICTTDEDCEVQTCEDPVATCNPLSNQCTIDGVSMSEQCEVVEDCPTPASPETTVTCPFGECLYDGSPMAIMCTTDEDCVVPPCVPESNTCEGAVEAIPETLAPGCDGCACESCVCENHPECCSVAWDESCTVACQSECDTPCGIETCSSNIDCFDGNSCTDEFCNDLGVCSYPISEACCSSDSQCDDGNPCTVNTCGPLGECQVNAAFDASCCPEGGVVFNADFESDVPFTVFNSSAAGGWQISTAESTSPTHSLWYGSKVTGDLNFGESNGALTSESILLPDSFTVSMSFQIWSDIAAPLQVFMVLDNGVEELIWAEIPSLLGGWSQVDIDLTPWKSQRVQLRMAFSTGGSTAKGVYLDDISITSDCSYPSCGDGECNGFENCFTCGEDCATPETCPENDGCSAWEYPGCVDCPCEAEVCETNPECCDVIWDAACVTACGASEAQDCGPTPGCVPGPAGCDGCECQECVCSQDSYCCNFSWDSICVNLCKGDCGQDCGPTVCDPGYIVNCDDGCTLATWPGDGVCDSVLNCEELNFDDGDCDGSTTGGGFF